MGTEDIKPYRFKKGESGNPKGRPKKTITLLREAGLSKDDIINAINALIDHSVEDLKKVAKNPETPVYQVNIATAIIKDIQQGRITTLDSIMDRLIGRATQNSTITGEITVRKRLFDD